MILHFHFTQDPNKFYKTIGRKIIPFSRSGYKKILPLWPKLCASIQVYIARTKSSVKRIPWFVNPPM